MNVPNARATSHKPKTNLDARKPLAGRISAEARKLVGVAALALPFALPHREQTEGKKQKRQDQVSARQGKHNDRDCDADGEYTH